MQADYQEGRFGPIESAGDDVLGVEIEPSDTMAVEVIRSSWAYLLVLILFVATAVVSGLDRRLERPRHGSWTSALHRSLAALGEPPHLGVYDRERCF